MGNNDVDEMNLGGVFVIIDGLHNSITKEEGESAFAEPGARGVFT